MVTAPAFVHGAISISDRVDDPSPSESFDWSAEPLRLCQICGATVINDPSPSGSLDWSAEPLRLCQDADAARCVSPSPVSVQPASDTETETEPRSTDEDASSLATLYSNHERDFHHDGGGDAAGASDARSPSPNEHLSRTLVDSDRYPCVDDTLLRLVSETFDSQDTQRERLWENDRFHWLARVEECRSSSRSPFRRDTDSDSDRADSVCSTAPAHHRWP